MAVDLRGWEISILGFVDRGRLGMRDCRLRGWKILILGFIDSGRLGVIIKSDF